ncbi:hypothetical protein HDV04_000583 [Boothiomyces sp. JEL0838]|nr:hypothetical protein HDV04_000583 [Boothiomyces sp. JEL0838]
MVSFVCDYCQETIKKPKLDQHYNRCGSTFSCIDCSTSFQGQDYKKHNSCISEAEKYQGALYKGKKTENKKKDQPKAQPETKSENVAKPIKSESLIDQIKKKAAQEPVKETAEPVKETAKPVKEKSKKRKSEKAESPEKKAKVEKKSDDESDAVKKAIQSVLKKKLSKKDVKVNFDQILTLSFVDETLKINI